MKTLFLLITLCLALLYGKTISIVGTADLQGMLEPSIQKVDIDGDGKREKVEMGGISHLATLYKQLKKDNPNTVIVSAGDDLMNRYFHVYKGKAILGMMSAAGYEILALGNHEFDKGTDVLAEALEGTSFSTLCSDLDVSESKLQGKCEDYLIKDIDGVKVGFFSLITESLLDASSAKGIRFKGSNVEMAKEMVKVLRNKGVDVIVLVSHIGYKEDRALAKQVKGIDVIFGGHSHAYIKKIGHIGKIAIVNGGEQGSQVVKVDIPLDENNKVLSHDIRMTKIPVTSKYIADAGVEKKLLQFKSKLPKTLVLGQTKKEWVMDSKVTRRGESVVADMVNDLMRKKYKVDMVLNNAGAFRGKKIYPKGNISNTMLKEIDEFGNYAYLLTMKGKYILEILEHSAAQYKLGGFMQVSGLKYTVKLPNKIQKIENEKIIQKGERVAEAKVLQNGKWVDIEPEKEYTVLTNSFIALKGGDGYYWFTKYGTDAQNTYATFYSIMAEEVSEHKELTPGNNDGRIMVIH
ncbi:bifunctional metallophosphatase/5'-nucleotidase [Sulfurovum sp. NBC37-1]|uniref:bifunctional metallophosphatase/5'-nucleotidase n=1 Tax=Sulfurovum sp. (strain NBC37-1) TaxID=387093 RepID=UPI0001587A0D|nr:5'-nucleotidase C-terminal domain-containing protein [Sulfurovum sp. NBC37-1]BAF72978.1 5'-nucleotidase [Sulfurovum sp. NBC37-1]